MRKTLRLSSAVLVLLIVPSAIADQRGKDYKEWQKHQKEAAKDHREAMREADKDYRQAAREGNKAAREFEREHRKRLAKNGRVTANTAALCIAKNLPGSWSAE